MRPYLEVPVAAPAGGQYEATENTPSSRISWLPELGRPACPCSRPSAGWRRSIPPGRASDARP